MDTLLIQAAGVFNLGIAALHLGFWRLFHWKEELRRLSRVNAGIMQAMNWVLTAALVGLGVLCLAQTEQVRDSALGRELMAGVALVWLLRAALQPWHFGVRHPASLAFVPVFVLGAALHAAPRWL